MPSIVPSYVYSLMAAIIVGSMVVYACSAVATDIRNKAERQQLTNVAEYIATESLALVSHSSEGKVTTVQFLDIPSQIGDQRYWIRILSDSSNTWIESGFGATVLQSQQRVMIPAKVTASGSITSGSGRAFLECTSENQIVSLNLSNGE